jgi:hypothetical protein
MCSFSTDAATESVIDLITRIQVVRSCFGSEVKFTPSLAAPVANRALSTPVMQPTFRQPHQHAWM